MKWVRGMQKETTNRAARHVTDYSVPFISTIRTECLPQSVTDMAKRYLRPDAAIEFRVVT